MNRGWNKGGKQLRFYNHRKHIANDDERYKNANGRTRQRNGTERCSDTYFLYLSRVFD